MLCAPRRLRSRPSLLAIVADIPGTFNIQQYTTPPAIPQRSRVPKTCATSKRGTHAHRSTA
eukprot:56712-Eustigmatos_ZCMA.PRE.1